jgi:hypothetical protein
MVRDYWGMDEPWLMGRAKSLGRVWSQADDVIAVRNYVADDSIWGGAW